MYAPSPCTFKRVYTEALQASLSWRRGGRGEAEDTQRQAAARPGQQRRPKKQTSERLLTETHSPAVGAGAASCDQPGAGKRKVQEQERRDVIGELSFSWHIFPLTPTILDRHQAGPSAAGIIFEASNGSRASGFSSWTHCRVSRRRP